jgi:pimeloyl-ACP methyl ester carboxylesterase
VSDCAHDVTTFVPAQDGRRLAVRIAGDPAGMPVILLHGTPGCRLGPLPKWKVLYSQGIQLISFDRPGYGRSDRLVARRVADVADDVEAIADAIGLRRFAVLGRSGGGPHALACAALLPDRVVRAGVLVSLAPPTAEGLDWFGGMTDINVTEYTFATTDPETLAARLIRTAAQIKANPSSYVASIYEELTESDRRVVADAGIRALLAESYAEALRNSADGWIDDSLAFCAPWGFDPSRIEVPVLLWHGEDDVFSPVAHTRWLAARIPGAISVVSPGAAHFDALRVAPDVLSWLIRRDQIGWGSRSLF